MSFSLSRTGHLAYLQGEALTPERSTSFVWVNRDGTKEAFTKKIDEYAHPNVSPDGKLVVMTIGPRGENRNWIVDIERSTSFRLNAENPNNALPVWSPQGDWIAFIGRNEDLYRIRPKPGAEPELVLAGEGAQIPTSWSPDGKEIIYTQGPLEELHKIKAVNVETKKLRVLVETIGDDVHGQVSPRGEWMAYTTSSSGKREVWVQRYPDAGAGRPMPILSVPSRDPVWAHDGSKLFILQDDNKALWPVTAPNDEMPEWGIPEKLFDFQFEIQVVGPQVSCYDVAHDGRFIFSMAPEKSDESNTNSREIHIVLNAFEEIKRIAPPAGNP